ncbi:MAG: hypothetical protein AAF547_23210 [Actinomycetota bacterium]
MADRLPSHRLVGPALVIGLFLVVVGCTDSSAQDAVTWAEEVEQRLAAAAEPESVVDCVLDVARVDLERNPLSEAATDELVRNCRAARAVIDGEGEVDRPPDNLALVDQPSTFGDDPTLDGLWTSCEAGSGAACDELFETAPVGTEYEEFGVSCGGRPEVLHCGELDVDPDAEPEGVDQAG